MRKTSRFRFRFRFITELSHTRLSARKYINLDNYTYINSTTLTLQHQLYNITSTTLTALTQTTALTALTAQHPIAPYSINQLNQITAPNTTIRNKNKNKKYTPITYPAATSYIIANISLPHYATPLSKPTSSSTKLHHTTNPP